MKNFISFIFLILFIFACTKNEGDQLDIAPPSIVRQSFILVDSLGNNILPYPMPSNPVFDPEDFWAYSETGNDLREIRGSNPHPTYYGFNPHVGCIFVLSEDILDIYNDPSFVRDSMITWYVFFGQEKDTIKIFPPFKGSRGASKVIWNQDTFYNNGAGLNIHKTF